MNCAADRCKYSHRGACLCGAREDSIQEYKDMIDQSGFTTFTPEVDLDETGKCTNFSSEEAHAVKDFRPGGFGNRSDRVPDQGRRLQQGNDQGNPI